MVYEIVWTLKAVETYSDNMRYLAEEWTEKEIKRFSLLVEKKLILLSQHPDIGSPQNSKKPNIRYTVLHKRISLVYKIFPQKKKIELLVFWNTYQNPLKLNFK